MSRTYRKANQMTPKNELKLGNTEPTLKRRFLNFKKHGPPTDGEFCLECGGLTEFQSGFLSCSKCGWTEDVIEAVEFMEGMAA